MNKLIIATLSAAMLAASFQVGAQQTAPTPSTEARPRVPPLLTQEERNQFREKMRAAKTRDERAAIQKEMRALTEQRAKEKGITLPQRREPGQGAGPRGGMPGERLMTPEERDRFRDKMRTAKTQEERAAVRNEMRSTIEQRAKEKGITLPGPQGGRGPQGGPGPRRDGNADRPALFTPEERQANREKMRAAKTPEERAELRRQMREQAEQRAREKGITLPPERRPAGPPKSPSTGN